MDGTKPGSARSNALRRSSSLDLSLALLFREANDIISTTDLGDRGIIAGPSASCFEVGLFLGEGSDCRWIVRIDKAAPNNPRLAEMIEESLASRGWGQVEVICEW